MGDEWRARLLAEPVHHVEHPFGDARLERELREERGGCRRVLRGLHDGGVPAEDCRERLPRDVRKRRVEAHDQRGDAERLPRREDGSVLHARGRRRGRTNGDPLPRRRAPSRRRRPSHRARAPPACRSPRRRSPRPPRDVRAGEARARARRRRERRPSARPMPVGQRAQLSPRRRHRRHRTARPGTEASRLSGAACRATGPTAPAASVLR